jgi:hypothetical protein
MAATSDEVAGTPASPIDQEYRSPDAATVPATPDGQTGTAALGVNDRGEILGVYDGGEHRLAHENRCRAHPLKRMA